MEPQLEPVELELLFDVEADCSSRLLVDSEVGIRIILYNIYKNNIQKYCIFYESNVSVSVECDRILKFRIQRTTHFMANRMMICMIDFDKSMTD